MALIPCKHCGNQVSDKAATCPHCGANPKEAKATQPNTYIEENATQTRSASNANKLLVGIIIVLILIIGGLGSYLLFKNKSNQTENKSLADSLKNDSTVVDTTSSDTTAVEKEVELKYTNLPDIVRMNLKGKVKSIHWTRFNQSEDPLGNGHGDYDWVYKFDRQGMLTSLSNDMTAYILKVGTFYYNKGKLTKMVTLGDEIYKYKYKQIGDHTINVTEINSDGEQNLAMTLTFYDNGNLKEKSILESSIDPYAMIYGRENDTYVVKYNSEGIEIDNKSSWGKLSHEEKDAKDNWTERIYKTGETFTREIQYY